MDKYEYKMSKLKRKRHFKKMLNLYRRDIKSVNTQIQEGKFQNAISASFKIFKPMSFYMADYFTYSSYLKRVEGLDIVWYKEIEQNGRKSRN